MIKLNYYEEKNTYNLLKDDLITIRVIKEKLIKCGIFFDENLLNSFYSYLPTDKYSQERIINKYKDITFTVYPITIFTFNSVSEDIQEAMYNYIMLYNDNTLKDILDIDEYNFLINFLNIKLFYTLEYLFNNIFIVRI